MKRSIAGVCALVLIVTELLSVVALGAGATITAGTGTAKVGEEVSIPITISDNPGIWGIDVKVSYDSEALELKSVTNGEIFANAELTPGVLTKVPYTLSYEASGFDNYNTSGLLATLTFEVKEAALTKDCTITLICNNGDAIDADEQPVAFALVNGGVTVSHDHVFTNYVSNNNATCKDDGTETATCDYCSETDTRTIVGSHLSVDHTSDGVTDCAQASYCTVCHAVLRAAGEHTWDEGVEQTPPTCEAKGSALFTCTVCGTTETRDVAALGHNYVEESTTAPTCTTQGYTHYVCSRDGSHTKDDDFVEALGHLFTNYVADGNATCKDDGTKTATCERDGCEVTDTITDVGSHLNVAHTPDGNTDCSKATYCTVCGAVIKPAGEHSWNEGEVTVEPGIAAGEMTYTCTVCHQTKTETLDPIIFTGSCGETATWTVNTQTGTLTIAGTGAMTDYTAKTDVPWYGYRESITTVVVEDGITAIGNRAFFDCANLTNVTIPASVTVLGDAAFYNCAALTTVELPADLTSIGAAAFRGCTALAAIEIPAKVTTIGQQAFYNCTSLTSIEIPNGVETIEQWTHQNDTSLTEVTIPASVTSIGKQAFYNCPALKDVYYAGTQEEWNQVTIGANNDGLSNATIHCHVHDWEENITTPATCEADGAKTMTCKTCGKVVEDVVIPALGHSFTNYVSNNDATCKDDGTKTAKCDRCDVTDTVTDVGSHLLVEHTPDGNKDCEKATYCTVCGTVLKKAGEHNWNIETTTPPTCTTKGEDTYTCKDCGKVETKELAALGDDLIYKAGETEADGNVLYETCSRCDHSEWGKVTVEGEGFTYKGTAFTPAVFSHSEGWLGGELQPQYIDDNVNAGTATAAIAANEVTALATFEIAKAERNLAGIPDEIIKADPTAELKLTFDDLDKSGKVIFTSFGPISVDGEGKITANGNGKAEVTVAIAETANYKAVETIKLKVTAVADPVLGVTAGKLTARLDGGKIVLNGLASDYDIEKIELELATGYTQELADKTITVKRGDDVIATYEIDDSALVNLSVAIFEECNKSLTSNVVEVGGLLNGAAAAAKTQVDAVDEGKTVDKVTLQMVVTDEGQNETDKNIYSIDLTPQIIVTVDGEDQAPVKVSELDGPVETKVDITNLKNAKGGIFLPIYVRTSHKANETEILPVGIVMEDLGIEGEKRFALFYSQRFSTFELIDDDSEVTISFAKDDSSVQVMTFNAFDANSGVAFPTDAKSGYSFKGWQFEGVEGTYTNLSAELMAQLGATATATAEFKDIPSSGGGGSTKVSALSVAEAKNGTVSVSANNATEGSTITVNAKPDAGYKLAAIKVTTASGKTVEVNENKGIYTFKMPGEDVTVSATFTEADATQIFEDVATNAYYAKAVEWAVEKGITTGTSATTFSPNASCTRAQMVTFLWRAAGAPETAVSTAFTDVKADAYYAQAVAWALDNGITNGKGKGLFDPNGTVTRAESITMLFRYAKGVAGANVKSGFTDVDAYAYYFNAVDWAVNNGITNGTTATTFSPNADCVRAQIVTFLFRLLGDK